MALPRVERFDLFRIDSAPVMTQQGFMQLRANLTRTGVLEYKRHDGTIQRELRHPDEVFDSNSLDTMRGMPLTDLHQAMVTPANATDLMRGMVGDDVRQDGKFVKGRVTVMDAGLIGQVNSGARRELSPGYTCSVEMTAGEHGGEKYDGIQRTIRYNHLAIGPKDWGRSGGDVAIKLDAAGAGLCHWDTHAETQLGLFLRDRLELQALTLDEAASKAGLDKFRLEGLIGGWGSIPSAGELDKLARLIDVPEKTLLDLIPLGDRGELPITRNDSTERTTMKITANIANVPYPLEVPDELASNFQTGLATLESRADSAEAARDELQGKLDSATADRDKLQGKLDEATKPEAIEKAVAERAQLHVDAAKVLGADHKFDGQSPRAIHEATIRKARKDDKLSFEGKSDAYVAGVFEGAVSSHTDAAPVPVPAAGAIRAVAAPVPGVRNDATTPPQVDPYDANAAQQRMLDRNDSLSKGELTYTKQG